MNDYNPLRQSRLDSKECYQGCQKKLCNDKKAINLEDITIPNVYEIMNRAQ